jgi:RNA polymerase sigma-70 factor (ECF subfamily)
VVPPVAAAVLDMNVAQGADQTSPIGLLVGDTPEVRAWVRAAQAGDRDAFDALVGVHYRAVYRTALAALQRGEDAEDATQDAFVLAWRKVAGFRGDSTFKTWLLTIVWRQALDRRRSRDRWWRRKQTPAGASTDDCGDGMADLAAGGADPERVTLGRARLADVRAAIATLTPKLRDTLLLASSGEHSYEEIATMLGVRLGTVKWRVVEARKIVGARCAGAGVRGAD